MKAARGRDEEFYDPARKEDILGRTKTSLKLWEEHLKDPGGGIGKGVGVLGMPTNVGIWSHRLSLSSLVFAMAFSIAAATKLQKMWEGPCWEGIWLFLDPWDVVGLRTSSSVRNVPGRYGPHGELIFFLIKKEPFALTKWSSGPLFLRRRSRRVH